MLRPSDGADAERHFLINRFGLHDSEVRSSRLLKADLNGRALGSA